MCFKAPCPSRGVFLPGGGELNERRGALLYTDAGGKPGPPELAGPAAARQAVSHAWHEGQCLEIMGRLEQEPGAQPRLHVSSVLGPCR